MATTRNSALYTQLDVNKYLSKGTDRGGRSIIVPFAHTVVSGETGGASAGTQDKVNLCVIPANARVINFALAREAMGASAGAGVTAKVGDSGDDDRYMAATDSDAAGNVAGLVFAGQNYTPTADTIVVLTWTTANPVVGKKIAGFIEVILP